MIFTQAYKWHERKKILKIEKEGEQKIFMGVFPAGKFDKFQDQLLENWAIELVITNK